MKLIEIANKTVLDDMKYFGLSKSDIDSTGHVTLYHGTISPTNVLKKNEIFFMTPSKQEAKEYANMRAHETGKKGSVLTIKVNPLDVNWNQGSGEVEFSNGGKIENGYLIPSKKQIRGRIKKSNKTEYKKVKVGDVLPKTKKVVLDITLIGDNKAQFKLNFDGNISWYDADTVINYEFK
jgi:hypothetical protein